MSKNIRRSLLIVLFLIIICTVVVVWNPMKENKSSNASSDGSSSLTNSAASSLPADSSLALIESSALFESSALLENSFDLETSTLEISDLIPEDQPDDPNLNYEASGSSYDDIMVNVLTCLLSKDMASLSEYVGSSGFRLAPTGSFSGADVVLSASELSDFFSLNAQSYGTYPGSGESIYMTPDEYYKCYMVPDSFDFSAASVSYNDATDINTVSGYVDDPKTVSYRFSPSAMDWKRLIIVYCSEGSSDVLCGIIYQDVTTN